MEHTGILVVSHGEFAIAALASAEMIAGKQQDVIALGLREDTTLQAMEESIWDAYVCLKETCSDVIILCDIYGGTPFNAISRNILKGMRCIAYTGLSLPLLIDLLLSRDLSSANIATRIEETHRQVLQPINVCLQGVINDEDLEL